MFENLFQHWIFWLVITLVVLVFLLAAKERGFRDKLNGSIDGKKYWLGFDAEWLEKNFSRVTGAIAIAGFALMMFGCSGGGETPAPTSAPMTNVCPSVAEGSIDMPPMSEVAAACNIDVKAAGLWRDGMTDAQAQAICSAPDNGLDGGTGGAYGGRYLTGAFHFEFDQTCQVVKDKTRLSIFGNDSYTVTGGLMADGKLGMGADYGLAITGRISDGKLLDGRLTHGGGKTHVFGVLNGTFTPAGKI